MDRIYSDFRSGRMIYEADVCAQQCLPRLVWSSHLRKIFLGMKYIIFKLVVYLFIYFLILPTAEFWKILRLMNGMGGYSRNASLKTHSKYFNFGKSSFSGKRSESPNTSSNSSKIFFCNLSLIFLIVLVR